jgi:WD40 repeat protein
MRYSLPVADGPIMNVSFLDIPYNNSVLISGNNLVLVWNVINGVPVAQFRDNYEVTFAKFLESYQWVIYADQQGFAYCRSLSTGNLIHKFAVSSFPVTSIALAQMSRHLYVWDSSQISVWDVETEVNITNLISGVEAVQYLYVGLIVAEDFGDIGWIDIVVQLDKEN